MSARGEGIKHAFKRMGRIQRRINVEGTHQHCVKGIVLHQAELQQAQQQQKLSERALLRSLAGLLPGKLKMLTKRIYRLGLPTGAMAVVTAVERGSGVRAQTTLLGRRC